MPRIKITTLKTIQIEVAEHHATECNGQSGALTDLTEIINKIATW